MASTFENNLRLEEIGTGEQSGTWGTKTNVNLELITDGLSYSSTGEAIANASTHTITMADGVADEFRSFYLKCTGGGQACTVTLAPNTLSKVWVIENTTSYTLTFSQGSGANVAILAGQVKMIATDGAGSGAAVFDLMQDLAVPDLFVDDDLKLQSDGAILSFGADGDTTLTHTDGSGLTLNSANKIMFRDSAISVSSSADATLDLAADGDINLTAGVDINIPANVGLTFGNDAEKIEGDGTDLTISGNNINLTAVADIVVPANVGITFGTGEKIEGDNTDITITSGADINLTATADINVPSGVGLTFGDDGEKIEGDGTDLTINASNDLNLTAATDINIPANVGLTFGDDGEKIEGDGTNLAINSSGDVNITATTVDLDGNLEVSGTITLGSGAVISEAELELLDGVTAGTAIASKVVTTDANIDTTGQRNLTITGELDAATGDFSGNVDIDGDLLVGDDLTLDSDAAVLGFGADTDVTLTHVADTGLLLNSSRQLQFGDAGTHIAQSADGVLTITSDNAIVLDAAGDASIDIDGADLNIKDGGVTYLEITHSTPDLHLKNPINDGDMLLIGTDNNSPVTALKLDMSEAGDAAFNRNVSLAGTLTNSTSTGGFITLKRDDTTLTDNADVGAINFETTDSDDAGVAATILGSGDGAAGAMKLRFYTGTASSKVERLTIDKDGNVGIGTGSPQTTLHVRKDDTAVVGLKLQNNTTNGIMEYQVGNDADNWFFGIDASDRFGISDATGQASQKLVITQSGDVGIGTSSPAGVLDIRNGTTQQVIIGNSGTYTGSEYGELLFKEQSTELARVKWNPSGNTFQLINNIAGPMTFATNGSEAMRIDSSGNIVLAGVTSNTSVISLDTSDGSDSKQLSLAGGGADSDGRGARARLYGNEHASKGGDIDISTGNASGAQMDLTATGVININSGAGGVIINEAGADRDFRVESDSNANALFVDGGNDKIGMFTSNPTDYYADTVVITTPDEGGITLVTGTGHANYLAFADGTSGDARYRGYVYYDHNTDKLLFAANSSTKVSISASDVVFNDIGADIDFRVESDNNANAIFVDAQNDHVCIGTSTDRGGLLNVDGTTKGIVVRTTNSAAMELIYADNGAGTGPIMYLNRPSSSPAADDQLGRIIVQGKNSADEVIDYVRLVNQLLSPTDGSEQGRFAINTMTSGTMNSRLNILNGESVFNDESVNVDFRVESDSNTHMLFADAGTNKIGVNQSSPDYTIHVGDGGESQRVHLQSNGGGAIFSGVDSANNSSNGFRWGHLNGTDRLEGAIGTTEIIDWRKTAFYFQPNGTESFSIGTASVIVNDQSLDLDLRVESDNNANMLFVDASADAIGIGSAPDSSMILHVKDTAAGTMTKFESTDDGVNHGPTIELLRNSSSPADSDEIGRINFNGKDSGGTTTVYTQIANNILDVTNGTEDGQMQFNVISGGSFRNFLHLTGSAQAVFNEDSHDIDFRVESNAQTHMLFVDGGNDVVNINATGTDKRFRVDSGNITTAAFNYVDASDVSLMQIKHARAGYNSNTATMIQFQNASGTEVGTIKSGASGTTFNTSSDYRLKENVVYDWDATTRLKQLKPARFNFIVDADTTVDGFLAHEAQTVVPEAVSGTHNQVDDNGDAVMQGIDQSKLVPLLVKTIQELEARIAALENA